MSFVTSGRSLHPSQYPSNALTLALICLITLLFLTFSLLRTGEGLSRGYQFSRHDLSHPAISLNLAYSLAKCGQYSNSANVVATQELATLGNHEEFALGRQVDCSKTQPSFAAENGFAIMIAPAIAVGWDTPFELATFLIVLKYALIGLAAVLAIPMFGRCGGIALGIATLAWAYWDEAFFYDSRLFLDFHVIEPYVWLITTLLCILVFRSSVAGKSCWQHWMLVGLTAAAMLYLRLLRSSDFYIQTVALVLVATIAALFILKGSRRLFFAISVAIIVATPLVLGTVHARWVEHRTCETVGSDVAACSQLLVNIEHPVWHPVVLGLAVPPSPISERFGFEWASDSETLKPAQFINPEVDKLYTPEFSRALRDFYVHIWTQLPGETIATYLSKIGSLYSIGWPALFFGLFAIIVGLWRRSLSVLFIALLFMGKAAESILIYPPYWSYYHQSAGVLAVGILVAVAANVFKKTGRDAHVAAEG